jgi:hypothetical protein
MNLIGEPSLMREGPRKEYLNEGQDETQGRKESGWVVTQGKPAHHGSGLHVEAPQSEDKPEGWWQGVVMTPCPTKQSWGT